MNEWQLLAHFLIFFFSAGASVSIPEWEEQMNVAERSKIFDDKYCRWIKGPTKYCERAHCTFMVFAQFPLHSSSLPISLSFERTLEIIYMNLTHGFSPSSCFFSISL